MFLDSALSCCIGSGCLGNYGSNNYMIYDTLHKPARRHNNLGRWTVLVADSNYHSIEITKMRPVAQCLADITIF